MRRHNPLWRVRVTRNNSGGCIGRIETIPMHAQLARAAAVDICEREQRTRAVMMKDSTAPYYTVHIDFVAVSP